MTDSAPATPNASKVRLLDAALRVIRSKGYAATRVEDVCGAAALTKGSFFHHFGGKEELAVAAADHFGAMADAVFAGAPYQHLDDPRERLLGYVDFRIAILQGELPDYTCLLGTMVQEVYDTHPAIRAACDGHLRVHTTMLARDVTLARRLYAPAAPWSADSLAQHIQAVIQGAFILAKARQGPAVAVECLKHLRRYLQCLFAQPPTEETAPCPPPRRRSPRSSGSTPTPKRR